MTWEYILKESIEKEYSPILEGLDKKKKKSLKKTLQSAEPTEYFGQDFVSRFATNCISKEKGGFER